MHWKKDSHGIFVKLASGEELFPSLEELAKEELPNGGMILMAIGMLKNAVVGYYNGKEYEKRTFDNGHELLGLHGSIRIVENADGGGPERPREPEPMNMKNMGEEKQNEKKVGMHIHCMMANERHEVVGGHLFSATVDPLVEMFIVPAEKTHIRVRFNGKTGLDEMKIE